MTLGIHQRYALAILGFVACPYYYGDEKLEEVMMLDILAAMDKRIPEIPTYDICPELIRVLGSK